MALSKVNPSLVQNFGRRNLVMNGNMEVNQRSFSSNTSRTQFTYAGDRWIFAKNDTINYDSSYNSFSLGFTDIPGAKAYHEFTLNSAGSGTDFVRLEQRIEDATTAAGEQVTLTFWARSTTGSSFTLDADGISEPLNCPCTVMLSCISSPIIMFPLKLTFLADKSPVRVTFDAVKSPVSSIEPVLAPSFTRVICSPSVVPNPNNIVLLYVLKKGSDICGEVKELPLLSFNVAI